jgi:uncharacterized membrane protein
MGQRSIISIVQRLTPWVFAIAVLCSFALDPEGLITSALCLVFSTVMMGYVVSRGINSLWQLDIWEKVIIALAAGIALPFAIYSVTNEAFDLSWNAMTVWVIVPLSVVSMVAMLVLKLEPLLEIGSEETSSSAIGEWGSMSRIGRTMIVLAMIAIILIASACGYLLLQKDKDGFSEFYILNEDGHAYDYPRNLTIGQNATVIIGIANHEGYEVNYTVELWLVNYTNINMAINVTQMFYMQSFSVILENQDYDLNKPWVPQFEIAVNITPAVAGEFQLFVLLFTDDVPDMPEPGTYNNTTNLNIVPSVSWRVVMCVNNEVNFLTLYVDVSS